MARRAGLGLLAEIFRFYQAGIANIAFGFGAYALLIWLGLNIYAAQVISHLLGMAFNYFTYSRHVFTSAYPAKTRFVLSYLVIYLISAALLIIISVFILSPYIAGLLVSFAVSLINYFILKRLVFVRYQVR